MQRAHHSKGPAGPKAACRRSLAGGPGRTRLRARQPHGAGRALVDLLGDEVAARGASSWPTRSRATAWIRSAPPGSRSIGASRSCCVQSGEAGGGTFPRAPGRRRGGGDRPHRARARSGKELRGEADLGQLVGRNSAAYCAVRTADYATLIRPTSCVFSDMLRIVMSSIMRCRSGEGRSVMGMLLSIGMHERAILTN